MLPSSDFAFLYSRILTFFRNGLQLLNYFSHRFDSSKFWNQSFVPGGISSQQMRDKISIWKSAKHRPQNVFYRKHYFWKCFFYRKHYFSNKCGNIISSDMCELTSTMSTIFCKRMGWSAGWQESNPTIDEDWGKKREL